MSFLASKIFKDVEFGVGEWRVKEEIEILCVWDGDERFWCGYVKNLVWCGKRIKEGCEDET